MVKKQHNAEFRHIIEILSMGIKYFLLYKWPLLSRVALNQSYAVSGHSNDHAAAREHTSLENRPK